MLAWLDANVEPGTVVVPVGFSQGGLMVTQLLRTAPERFAAGVVLSGFVLDGPLPGDEALAERRPRCSSATATRTRSSRPTRPRGRRPGCQGSSR
ncbi:hypothetical protein NKG05_01970 [Oerskovia sp. M15]